MTAVLDRFPVEEITREAREIHPGRTLLTWVAALLFGVGWLAFKAFAVLWLAAAWVFVATRKGWRAAKVNHGPARPG
jgi:hypothetical protein